MNHLHHLAGPLDFCIYFVAGLVCEHTAPASSYSLLYGEGHMPQAKPKVVFEISTA
jgi:hypothetical protein